MKIKGDTVVMSVHSRDNEAIGHITVDSSGLYRYHILSDHPTIRSELKYVGLGIAETFLRRDMVHYGYSVCS
jgi:hypothetical protein